MGFSSSSVLKPKYTLSIGHCPAAYHMPSGTKCGALSAVRSCLASGFVLYLPGPWHNKKDSRFSGVLFYRLMKALLFIGDIVGTLLGNPTADACLLQHIFRQFLFLRSFGFCYLCTGSFLFRLGLIGVDLLGPLTGAHQNPTSSLLTWTKPSDAAA